MTYDTPSLNPSDTFQCPSCAGVMSFDPQTKTLKCPYCKYSLEINQEKKEIQEYDLDSFHEENLPHWDDLKATIKCESCGALTQFDRFETSKKCAFCGSNHVIEIDQIPGIKPEFMIPFAKGKDQALDAIKKFMKGRWFAPRQLITLFVAESMHGIYVPYWHFDSQTESDYSGLRGDYYYVTRTVGSGKNRHTVRERRIRWRPVSGHYSHYYDDVEVSASGTRDASIFDRILPFDYQGLVPYDKKFLAGFVAERYGVKLIDGWSIAQQKIHQSLNQSIRHVIGGDVVSNLNIHTNFSQKRFKHLLVPVWVFSYQFKKKKYSLSVNGQTGKVNGKTPVSVLKVGLVTLLVMAIIALFVLLIVYYQ